MPPTPLSSPWPRSNPRYSIRANTAFGKLASTLALHTVSRQPHRLLSTRTEINSMDTCGGNYIRGDNSWNNREKLDWNNSFRFTDLRDTIILFFFEIVERINKSSLLKRRKLYLSYLEIYEWIKIRNEEPRNFII